MLDGLLTILQTLFGWLFLMIFQMLLGIVDIIERFFDVFAGTEPVYYKGEEHYLFNLFFSNSAITKLFWAMAIIGAILSFGFCIIAVTRKVVDVSGTSKHTLGQIMSNFIRSLVVILLLNICIIVAINMTSVIFDRINFSLENAEVLDLEQEREYTDEEFATMARILATMGNYAANPSAESRYNVNSCFNAIRGEMLTLFEARCFDYDFTVVQTGKHTWQSALAQVAKSANLKEDLQLDTYYPAVQDAIILCFDELKTNIHFKPQESAVLSTHTEDSLSTAKMIFLVASMGAEENLQFKNGSFDDALRRSYINDEKNFLLFNDVDSDFAITKINYLVGLIATLAIILFLGKLILMFVVRMLNLILLYIVSPLFASSMSLDEGSRFQNWTQSFVMQLLGAYAGVVMMRVYLLLVPIVINTDLHFFPPESVLDKYDIYGRLLFVLAGSWAIASASTLISGALTGNATSALQDADSTFGREINDLLGYSGLKSELSRWRNRRDQKKNNQQKKDENKPNKANNTVTNNRIDSKRGNRKSISSDKQQSLDKQPSSGEHSVSSSMEKASLQRMRDSYGMGAKSDTAGDNSFKSADKAFSEEHSRTSDSLNRMREMAGLDSPNAPDKFSLDSLPDLGLEGRSYTGGNGRNGLNGGQGSVGTGGKKGLKGDKGATGTNGTGSTVNNINKEKNPTNVDSRNRKSVPKDNKNEENRNRLKKRMSRTTDNI